MVRTRRKNRRAQRIALGSSIEVSFVGGKTDSPSFLESGRARQRAGEGQYCYFTFLFVTSTTVLGSTVISSRRLATAGVILAW